MKIIWKALSQQSKIAKCEKFVSQKIQHIQDTLKSPNLRIIGVEKNDDLHLIGTGNTSTKL